MGAFPEDPEKLLERAIARRALSTGSDAVMRRSTLR
jgi:hypothetical protein